jgi:alanine racemase
VHLAAVVKAQAYGVGAEEIARAAVAAGATWLAVARVHEGVELRASGIRAPILVLTRTDPREAEAAVAADLAITVDAVPLGEALGAAARKYGRVASVHVKVDTGLHRFGVEPAQVLELLRPLANIEGVQLEGLYTHFASADESDPGFTESQAARYQHCVADLAAAGFRFPIRHAANSAATLGHPATHYDLVRVGLALYGVSPSGVVPDGLDLRRALALKARIARILQLAPGEGVGYGQTWRATRPTRVALVTAGYADGVPRALSNRGVARLRGQEVPIIGRVSMDLTTVDITECPAASVHDVVTFFGADEHGEISLEAFADRIGTIPHEALTLLGGRVARVYHENGAVVRVARLSAATGAAP